MNWPSFDKDRIKHVAKQTFDDVRNHDTLAYAAALGFHAVLALFPFLIFLIALLGYLDLAELYNWLVGKAEELLPPQTVSQVTEIVDEVLKERNGGLLSFGILGAIWAASAGMRSAMNALNAAYDVQEGRPFLRRYAVSIGFTIALSVLLVISVGMLLLGGQAGVWVAEQIGIGGTALTLWNWLRWPAIVIILMFAASLAYYAIPNVQQRFTVASTGSVIAVALWLLVSFAFKLYVAHFGRFDIVYGSIGAVIVLLLYFYLSSLVLLIGAEVNGVLRQQDMEPKRG